MASAATESINLVRRAYDEANSKRPFKRDEALVNMITPDGGRWICVAAAGAITRTVVFNGKEVAHVNPAGDFDDESEAHVAMAIRALPQMDAALRSILVMSDNPDNLPLIKRLAAAVIEYVERPAPEILERDEDESDSAA